MHTTPTTAIYTLSLHDALPISTESADGSQTRRDDDRTGEIIMQVTLEIPDDIAHRLLQEGRGMPRRMLETMALRSEEHTSELQSHSDLVCRLLLEKKKKTQRHK